MLTIYRVLRDFNGGFGPVHIRSFLDSDKAQAYASQVRAINPKFAVVTIVTETAFQ